MPSANNTANTDPSNNPDLRQRKPTENSDDQSAQNQNQSSDSSTTTGGGNSPPNTFGILTPPQYHNYGCAEAYAQAVRTWIWAYHSWQFAQAMAPFHIHQSILNAQKNQGRTHLPGTSPVSSTTVRTTVTTDAAAQPRVQGNQHIVATYGRRLLAELIDFSFCFVLKLLVVYFMVEVNLIDIDKYEKLLGDQADLKTFIDITQDLFPVEVANKVVTSLIEGLYVTYGWGSVPPGFTPGKFILGLKVISCDKVYAFAPRDFRIIVEGEKPVSLGTSSVEQVRDFDRQFSRWAGGLCQRSAEVGGRALARPQTSRPPAKLAIKASHLRKRRQNR